MVLGEGKPTPGSGQGQPFDHVGIDWHPARSVRNEFQTRRAWRRTGRVSAPNHRGRRAEGLRAGTAEDRRPPVTRRSRVPRRPRTRADPDLQPAHLRPSEGSASPRKPKLWMFSRSEPSILDVACRDSGEAADPRTPSHPQPSSVTRTGTCRSGPSSISPRGILTALRASSASRQAHSVAEAGRSNDLPRGDTVDRGLILVCPVTGLAYLLGYVEDMPQNPSMPRPPTNLNPARSVSRGS